MNQSIKCVILLILLMENAFYLWITVQQIFGALLCQLLQISSKGLFNYKKQLRICSLYLLAFGTGNNMGIIEFRISHRKRQHFYISVLFTFQFLMVDIAYSSIPVNAQCESFMFNTYSPAGIANSNTSSSVEFSLYSFLSNWADVSLEMNALMPHAKRPKACVNNVY